jgi:hypothetical protein
VVVVVVVVVVALRNYRKQPHWALHTYFIKYPSKDTKDLTWEIALHVP